jgi:hypothetical protein
MLNYSRKEASLPSSWQTRLVGSPIQTALNSLLIITGGYDVYGGNMDETIKRATQYPVLDPSIVSVNYSIIYIPYLMRV